MADRRDKLDFSVKGPIPILLEEERNDLRSGCSVLEIHFKKPTTVGEIRFRNYYTAYLSLALRRKATENETENKKEGHSRLPPWEKSVSRMLLMSDPHCEQGSQDLISITQKNSCLAWMGILAMRLVLRQPSPQWRKFGIGDLQVYRQPPDERFPRSALLRLLGDQLPSRDKKPNEKVESASDHVLNLWALLMQLKELNQRTSHTLGRYEVNSNYDIDYLSYT